MAHRPRKPLASHTTGLAQHGPCRLDFEIVTLAAVIPPCYLLAVRGIVAASHHLPPAHSFLTIPPASRSCSLSSHPPTFAYDRMARRSEFNPLPFCDAAESSNRARCARVLRGSRGIRFAPFNRPMSSSARRSSSVHPHKKYVLLADVAGDTWFSAREASTTKVIRERDLLEKRRKSLPEG